MAKFRRNYSKSGTIAATLVRVTLLLGILVTLIFLLYIFFNQPLPITTKREQNLPPYLPASSTGQIVGDGRFWISWDSTQGLAEWAACLLTPDSAELFPPVIDMRNAPFPLTSAHWEADTTPYFKASLFPTGFDADGGEPTDNLLYKANICPQVPDFYKYLWRNLQQQTLRWAEANDTLLVVSGPVLGAVTHQKSSLPEAYYQVLLSIRAGEQPEAIGFIFPHQTWKTPQQPLDFAVSVNEVEKVTGLDFFPKYLDDSREEILESKFNLLLWK